MPPVITCQSVVDSTVAGVVAVYILYPHLDGPQHRLVLFDVNGHQGLSSVQRPESNALIDALSQATRGYTLDSLGDEPLRKPDRVLLVSPAINLTRLAALANIIDLLGVVPLQGLEKVHWQAIVAEYDPYKFNSFPVNATRQILSLIHI